MSDSAILRQLFGRLMGDNIVLRICFAESRDITIDDVVKSRVQSHFIHQSLEALHAPGRFFPLPSPQRHLIPFKANLIT